MADVLHEVAVAAEPAAPRSNPFGALAAYVQRAGPATARHWPGSTRSAAPPRDGGVGRALLRQACGPKHGVPTPGRAGR